MCQQSHRAGSWCCFYTLQQRTHINKYIDTYKHTHRDDQQTDRRKDGYIESTHSAEMWTRLKSTLTASPCCVCVCITCSCEVKPRCHCHTHNTLWKLCHSTSQKPDSFQLPTVRNKMACAQCTWEVGASSHATGSSGYWISEGTPQFRIQVLRHIARLLDPEDEGNDRSHTTNDAVRHSFGNTAPTALPYDAV